MLRLKVPFRGAVRGREPAARELRLAPFAQRDLGRAFHIDHAVDPAGPGPGAPGTPAGPARPPSRSPSTRGSLRP